MRFAWGWNVKNTSILQDFFVNGYLINNLSHRTYICLSNSGSGREGGQLGHSISVWNEAVIEGSISNDGAILAYWGGDCDRDDMLSMSKPCIVWGWSKAEEGAGDKDQKLQGSVTIQPNLIENFLTCPPSKKQYVYWMGTRNHLLFVGEASLARLYFVVNQSICTAWMVVQLTDPVLQPFISVLRTLRNCWINFSDWNHVFRQNYWARHMHLHTIIKGTIRTWWHGYAWRSMR